MADMKLFIELLAKSTGLKRELRESESGFQRFGNVAKREMASIRQASSSLQGQLAALGLTVGALQQFRVSAQLDKDLTQIGQTAGAGAKQVAALRSDIFRMGKQSGQDLESLKNGFDSLVQSGLNMREATSTLDGINVAMAVTGVKAETLSSALTVASTHFDFDLSRPGQALALLDKMTVAGRLGNAELGKLSDVFSRVGVSAKASGMNFDKTLAFIEALSQAEKNPERLGTLATSSLRMFTDGRYMSKTQQGLGMQNLFFDKKGIRRDVFDVFGDIQTKYKTLKTDKQRAGFIHAAFGEMDTETKTGIQLMLNGPNLTKAREFQGIIGGASGTLKKDFNEATTNLISQGGRLKNTMRDAADGFIGPINKAMADFIKSGLDKKSEGGMELSGKQIIGGTAAIIGGAYVLSRVGKSALGSIAGRLLSQGGSTAIGVAEGKALQAAAGVTPVFVTNWPGAGIPIPGLPPPGGPVPIPGGKNLGKAIWRLAQGGGGLIPQLATRGGLIGTALGVGYGAGYLLEKQFINGKLGEAIFDIVHPQKFDMKYASAVENSRSRNAQNFINFSVEIDSRGKVSSRSDNMDTFVKKIDKRGDFFQAFTTTDAM